ncbi:MAG: hypothetical protein IAG13_07000, partial [Deltaproteobacteria bacterium]|nr:hypothetical protein [Nannocystaceae bacterium]
DPGAGDAADGGSVAEPAPAVLETIDDKAGVVVSDELVFQRVDVRERKIELKVEATRASAQARLVYKLRDIACLSNIEKGKAKGEARKVFDMVMDNNCYYASSIGTGTESPAAEGPSETDDEPASPEGGE